MRFLVLLGSLRRGSYNGLLARAAAEVAPDGVELVEWRRLDEVPAFNADLEESPPEAVRRLRAAVAEADALLIVTPEYNASLPGTLKNALDWLSRPFPGNVLWGKPSAVVGTTTGFLGGRCAHADGRRVLARAGARPLEAGLSLPAARDRFDGDGRLVDDRARAELGLVVEALADEASANGDDADVRRAA